MGIWEVFDEVCREMGVKPGKVALVWDYLAEVPELTLRLGTFLVHSPLALGLHFISLVTGI